MEPVSQTAFYCAGVRAQDAERARPICGDRYARLFLGEDGRAVFDRFRRFARPNGSNITRHRIIDDLLRERLLEDAARPVVLLGAGFDSRPFRLKGGHWLELDAAPLIARKNEHLPASGCPNPLERIAVDFSPAALREALDRFHGAATVTVVVEGVLMYLPPQKINQLLEVLRKAFPQHELICDLMTERFFTRYSADIHAVLAELGATFQGVERDPRARFLDAGYTETSRTSIPLRAAELHAIDLPAFVIRWFLPSLRTGYAIHTFERAP
jgi:methyltransferase (TIGR00027 family)